MRYPKLYKLIIDTFSDKAVLWMLKYRPKYSAYLENEITDSGELDEILKDHLFEQLDAVEWDFSAKRG